MQPPAMVLSFVNTTSSGEYQLVPIELSTGFGFVRCVAPALLRLSSLLLLIACRCRPWSLKSGGGERS